METLDIALLPVFYFNKMLAIMIPKYCSTRTTVTGLIICLDVWLQYLKRKREGETANLQFWVSLLQFCKKIVYTKCLFDDYLTTFICDLNSNASTEFL